MKKACERPFNAPMKDKKVFLLIVSTIIALVACNMLEVQSNTSLPPIPANDLLLDVNVFPKDWASTPCDTSLCRQGGGGITAAERDFYLPAAPGHVYQEVFRFSSEQKARNKFAVYMEGNFNESGSRKPFVPFSPPPEITFQSKIADEYYFACGVDIIPQCKMLARYQNYFVFFYFDRLTEESPGGLTYFEIEKVLEALEVHVGQELSFPAQSASIPNSMPQHRLHSAQ